MMAASERPGEKRPGDDDDYDYEDDDAPENDGNEPDDDEGGIEGTDEEIEARARALGWIPESEWRDNGRNRRPKHFKTAREFLEDGNASPAMLRERLAEMGTIKAENAELKGRVDELGNLVSTLHETVKKVGQAGYEKAKRELLAKREAAVEDGDKEAFAAVDKELTDLETAQREAAPAPKPPGDKPGIDPYVREWSTKNAHWFAGPRIAWAQRREQEINRDTPGRTVRDVLDQIAEEAKDEFPRYFRSAREEPDDDPPPRRENPRRDGAPGVLSPNDRRDRGGPKMRFESLPREDRETFERLKKQFATRGVTYTPAMYLEDYQKE